MNRREMLFAMAASGAGMLAPQLYARPASDGFLNSSDERFLDAPALASAVRLNLIRLNMIASSRTA